MASYYRHSGKFAPQGPILGLLGGIVVSIPAALLYVYSIFTVPEVELRFLCPFIFGALLGGVCGAMMCLGKVRSNALAGIVGFAASSIGLYMSWVVWIRVLCFNRNNESYNGCSAALFRPLETWKAVLALNLQGTWSFRGHTPTHGALLWFVWAVEALIVVGFGIMAAVGLVHNRPFCERCGQWCKKKLKLYFAPTLSANDFKTQLESGDVSMLEKLPPGNRKQPHYRIDLHICSVCHQLNTLTLGQILPPKQTSPRIHKTLMNKLLLTGEQASVLRNIEMNHRAVAGANSVPTSTK